MEKARKKESPPKAQGKRKDRLLNLLMLLAVALALGLSALRGESGLPESEKETLSMGAALTPVSSPTPHPAEAYRARRQAARLQEEESLRTLAKESPAEQTRAMAEEALLQMQADRETELAVEAALSGMGYGNALCVARKGSVTIIVDQPLTAAQAALILALAQETSGADAENIRISAC